MNHYFLPGQAAEWTPARQTEIAARFPSSWPVIEQLIGDAKHLPKVTKADHIVALCAEFACISIEEMLSCRRRRGVVDPRMAAAYLIDRECPSFSLGMTGRKLGNRDHTTVLSAKRRVENDLANGGERFGEIVSYVQRGLLVACE